MLPIRMTKVSPQTMMTVTDAWSAITVRLSKVRNSEDFVAVNAHTIKSEKRAGNGIFPRDILARKELTFSWTDIFLSLALFKNLTMLKGGRFSTAAFTFHLTFRAIRHFLG